MSCCVKIIIINNAKCRAWDHESKCVGKPAVARWEMWYDGWELDQEMGFQMTFKDRN